jgi:hypothetical protein
LRGGLSKYKELKLHPARQFRFAAKDRDWALEQETRQSQVAHSFGTASNTGGKVGVAKAGQQRESGLEALLREFTGFPQDFVDPAP